MDTSLIGLLTDSGNVTVSSYDEKRNIMKIQPQTARHVMFALIALLQNYSVSKFIAYFYKTYRINKHLEDSCYACCKMDEKLLMQ